MAGADEIAGYQLERLADACDRTGTPLTLLFRHLRNDATALIGAGATAFMRLGNHHEAEQAASFIGRQHKFVLSSLTGGRTRSRDFSKNYSWATEFSRSDGTNWSDATTRERVYEYAVEPGVLQRLPDTALLLISDNSDVQPVECHPAIVTLPQASTVPVQPVQPPAPLPRADQYQPQ